VAPKLCPAMRAGWRRMSDVCSCTSRATEDMAATSRVRARNGRWAASLPHHATTTPARGCQRDCLLGSRKCFHVASLRKRQAGAD